MSHAAPQMWAYLTCSSSFLSRWQRWIVVTAMVAALTSPEALPLLKFVCSCLLAGTYSTSNREGGDARQTVLSCLVSRLYNVVAASPPLTSSEPAAHLVCACRSLRASQPLRIAEAVAQRRQDSRQAGRGSATAGQHSGRQWLGDGGTDSSEAGRPGQAGAPQWPYSSKCSAMAALTLSLRQKLT